MKVTATIDDAYLNNGGVLIQVMDNDDNTTGGVESGMEFYASHVEDEGFNTESTTSNGNTQTFTFTNGTYEGNIYNASGSDSYTRGSSSGNQGGPSGGANQGATGSSSIPGSTLAVNLGTGATLKGAAASTAAIHVTYEGSVYVQKKMESLAFEDKTVADEWAAAKYDGTNTHQNTSFDITQYYDIGQVANLINYNSANDINITLTDDAVWNVTGTSDITSLTFSGENNTAQVVVPSDVKLKVESGTYANSSSTDYPNEYSGVVITSEGITELEDEGALNTEALEAAIADAQAIINTGDRHR